MLAVAIKILEIPDDPIDPLEYDSRDSSDLAIVLPLDSPDLLSSVVSAIKYNFLPHFVTPADLVEVAKLVDHQLNAAKADNDESNDDASVEDLSTDKENLPTGNWQQHRKQSLSEVESCPLNEKDTDKSRLLPVRRSRRKRTKVVGYLCDVDQCTERFRTRHDLRLHHKSHHIDLFCIECATAFATLGQYSSHLCARTYKCETCGRGFNTVEAQRQHVLIHTGNKPHVCDHCGKRFRQESTLTRHKLTHEKVGRFSCDICKKFFKFKHYLNQHKLIHTGSKPHRCDFCSKEFRQRSNLNKHVLMSHTQLKEFVCPVCHKGFVKQYYLNRHLLTHKDVERSQKNDLPIEATASDSCIDIRNVRCNLCFATMKTEESLRNHMLRFHPDMEAAADGNRIFWNS